MSTVIQVILLFGHAFELSLLARATAVIVLGLVAVHLGRSSRASVRHFILIATFAGASLLPLLLITAPGIPIRGGHTAG